MQGRTKTGVLFITHDFGVVSEIADRVVVMQMGRIVEQGPCEELLRAPREEYTRMLLRAVPSMTPPKRLPVTGPVVLQTENLFKTYGKRSLFQPKARVVAAVKDVSLTIRRGETLGIVGESGSGKSTVARCVARLVETSAGGIKIDGIDIAAMREAKFRPMRRRVQFIFQDPYRSLNPRRTVGEAIIEGPMNFGVSRKEALQRARDLMAIVHLPPAAIDRFPHQFSGGQRQRICIARALAMEPELLIGDEPVSALDVSVQDQVLKLLDEVRRKFNLAVLFITHDLRVAAQVCDRIAVMQRGVIVEQGTTAEVFAAPQHEYTRALFDAAPGKHQEFAASACCAAASARMRLDMRQQQFADPLRRGIGREMPDPGQHLELIGGGDKIPGALGGDAADGVVGIAPDVERGHPDRAKWAADRTTRAIPGQCRLHRVLVAQYFKVPLDRVGWNAIGGEAIAQPFAIVCQHHFGGVRLEERLVVL
jgi:peptide/nickel transport system ATP-binding protein